MKHTEPRTVITRIILLACTMLAWSPCVFALNPELDVSQYAHTSWKIRDGFIKTPIGNMAQTPDGYLWLGTEVGLYRFDGIKAVAWRPPSGELPSNFIRRLRVSRDGTLWIGTLKGLVSWKDGKLVQYPTLADESIDALLDDDKGTLWVGTLRMSGARLCSIRNGNVECSGGDGRFGKWIEILYEDSRKNIWATTEKGLLRLKPEPPELISFPSPLSGSQLALMEGDQSALLIITENGIMQYLNGKIEPYAPSGIQRQVKVRHMFRDRDGGIWVARGGAAGLLHIHAGRTDLFTRSDGLSGDDIWTLFEDRAGDIWVATNGGLDRFREFAVTTLSERQGLSNAVAGAVLADKDGGVWLGTAGSLDRWQHGEISEYGIGQSNLTPYALFHDSRDRLWVCNENGVGYLENSHYVSVSGIPGGAVRGMAEDTAGVLWIANLNSGLLKVSARNEIQKIPWTSLGRKTFATALAADPLRGGLWLGFYDGGVAYFADGQIQASYSATEGLGRGFVDGFKFDPDGTVWAGTEGGLSRLKNGRIATLTSKNGLPCDAVNWVIEDNDHSFWLSMPCGLVRITRPEIDAWASAVEKNNNAKRTIQATVFDGSDGAVTRGHPSGYSPRVTRSADGKLWFATGDGVSVVDPRHLAFNSLPPPVHIEQVAADRKLYDLTREDNGRLRLPALSRDLEIDFTALSFVAPEKIRFRYKLEGYDSDWQEVGNRRQAFYTNLPPRNYRFRVIACNNSGVWNEAGTFLDFAIAPAYYQTLWFRLLLVVAFLSVLFLLYRLRVQQVTQRLSGRMEARVEERERIARDLHDTLIQSVQGLILKFHAVSKQLPQEEVAHGALEQVLDRADEVLAEARDRVRNLRSATEIPRDLPSALKLVAEEQPEGGGAIFKTVVEGKVRPLHPLVFEETYSIGREAITNALKHSQGHHIEAEIIYEPRHFRLRVRDDGRGFDPKIFHDGASPDHFGLRGIRERAERIGAQVSLWSGPDTGTEVELVVPGATAYRSHDQKPRRFWRRRS
jgi:signal transduction histidine kinase/ligand-binding sensor domain-containing protein